MQQRAERLDFIKVFAVLATLFLHSNSTLVNFQTSIVSYPVELNIFYWKISVVFASFAGPSFALIFMYLGARVLSSSQSSISFYFSKIKNLLVSLLFWTIFALLFQKYVMHWEINFMESLLLSPFQAVALNLWILYLLIGIFFIIPILKIFVNNSTTRQQFYFIILWVYVITIPPLLKKYYNLDITFYMPMMTGYIGYILIGYLLSKIEYSKRVLFTGLFLFIIGNLWTIAGSIYYSIPEEIVKGIYANYFFDRFGLPMLLNSIGSFILLRFIAEYVMQRKTFYKGVKQLSSVALGLCMVYPYWFIILGTEKIGIELTAFAGNPLWSVPLTAVITIIFSYVTVWTIQKIPYLHHVTPKLY